MPSEIFVILKSQKLLSELINTNAIHQQDISCDGWTLYRGISYTVLFASSKEVRNPVINPGDEDHRDYFVDEDYKALRGWSEAGQKTVWLDGSGSAPVGELPFHDYEIQSIEQLDRLDDNVRVPTLTQCLAWWEDWQLPENVRHHVTRVAWAAYTLARMLREQGVIVDPILTHRGGLLHDLDKIKTLKVVNQHGRMGAEFLKAEGYPEVGEIVRDHIMHTILEPDADERLWEVKLVYFCDKLTEGDRIVTLEERFSALGKRYPAYMEKMEKAKTHVWALNDRICSLLMIPDNEHLVSILNQNQ